MPNSEKLNALRYALYYHFLLGSFNSVADMESLLEYFLDDAPYPIGFGDDRGILADGLIEEMCRVREMRSPGDAMQVWQASRHILVYLSAEQQEEFRVYLRDIPVDLSK